MENFPIQTGNAETDSRDNRGWLVGSFLDESFGLRSSEDVEVKWGYNTAGESRRDWVTNEVRTTLAVLVLGRFEMEFRDQVVTLSKSGDYVMWGRGVDHKWRAVEDSTLITVRWPSIIDR